MSRYSLRSHRNRLPYAYAAAAFVIASGVAVLISQQRHVSNSLSDAGTQQETLVTPTLITDQILTTISTGNTAARTSSVLSLSRNNSCTGTPINSARLTSTDPIIAQLASGAETACGSQLFSGAMRFFAPNPTEVADWQASALKEASRLGMGTVLVLEPDNMSFDDIAAGRHDAQLRQYFEALRQHVTSQELGTVVVCGEPIVGGRKDATADNYISCIEHFVAAAKASFPDAALSTIVDEAEIESLATSLPKLKATGIDSIGLQAFSNGDTIRFDGDQPNIDFYFDVNRIRGALDTIGADKVWVNTGVTKADKWLKADYSPRERTQVANALARRINTLGNVQFVNLFMENKFNKPEGRDFSVSSGDSEWLIEFIDALNDGVTLYGFDS